MVMLCKWSSVVSECPICGGFDCDGECAGEEDEE